MVEELPRHLQEVRDERAAQGVVGQRTGTADTDEVAGAERGQVLRHDRLIEIEGALEFLDRPLAGGEDLEDANPLGMCEGAKQLALDVLERGGQDIDILLYTG